MLAHEALNLTLAYQKNSFFQTVLRQIENFARRGKFEVSIFCWQHNIEHVEKAIILLEKMGYKVTVKEAGTKFMKYIPRKVETIVLCWN